MAQRKERSEPRPLVSRQEFNQRLAAAHLWRDSKMARAAERVLVEGMTGCAASVEVGVDPAITSRAIKKIMSAIPASVCPCCERRF